jgi:serine/threonine protein kinase
MNSPERQLYRVIQPSTPVKRKTSTVEGTPKRTKVATPVSTPTKPASIFAPNLQPFYWPQYDILAKLGEGAFGKVYGIIEKATGQKFALKLTVFGNEQSRIEASILGDLSARCPSLVRYYQSLLTNDPEAVDPNQLFFGVLMQWVEGPNLREEIAAGRLPNMKQFLTTARQLLEQLACVHAADIVHRDIKPENIVFDTSSNQAKLVDFGIGCTLGQANRVPACIVEPLGTLAYMAPELPRRRADNLDSWPASAASDIWSLGATLYEWLFGERVLTASYKGSVEKEIAKVQAKAYLPEFLKQMLAVDHEKRPTAQQLLLSLAE